MDIYTIIFLALAVLIFLRLRSVLGQRTHQRRRIPVTGIFLTLTAAALGAVFFDVGGASVSSARDCCIHDCCCRPSAAPPALSTATPSSSRARQSASRASTLPNSGQRAARMRGA